MPPKLPKLEVVEPLSGTVLRIDPVLDKEAVKLKAAVIKGVFDIGSEALTCVKEWTRLQAEKERTQQAALDRDTRIREAELRLEEAKQRYQAQAKQADTEEANASLIRRAAETLLSVLSDNRPGPDADPRQLDRFVHLHEQLLRYCSQLRLKG